MLRRGYIASLVVAAVCSAQVTNKLNLEEQIKLYEKLTGPYCDEHAFSDPLCQHKAQEIQAEAWRIANPWQAPTLPKTEDYCTRFPEICEKANRLSIDPSTRFFCDSFGRTTLLHGLNIVFKVQPYIPSLDDFDAQESLNDEDIANLKKWGINFVRLSVMWEAVERQPGQYDMDYLD